MTLVLALAATQAAAQELFDFNTAHYRSWDEYYGWMTASRFALILASSATGFGLGWFSDQRKLACGGIGCRTSRCVRLDDDVRDLGIQNHV